MAGVGGRQVDGGIGRRLMQTMPAAAMTQGASPGPSQNPGKESAKGAPRTAQKSPEGGTSTGRILGLKIFLGKKGRGGLPPGSPRGTKRVEWFFGKNVRPGH